MLSPTLIRKICCSVTVENKGGASQVPPKTKAERMARFKRWGGERIRAAKLRMEEAENSDKMDQNKASCVIQQEVWQRDGPGRNTKGGAP